jgi:hypothetical protein
MSKIQLLKGIDDLFVKPELILMQGYLTNQALEENEVLKRGEVMRSSRCE